MTKKNNSTWKQTTQWMTKKLPYCIQEKHRYPRLSVNSSVFKTESLN